jgi:hypothetical protein
VSDGRDAEMMVGMVPQRRAPMGARLRRGLFPAPGAELVELLEEVASRGAPFWSLGGAIVPRMTWSAEGCQPDGRLPLELIHALETGTHGAWEIALARPKVGAITRDLEAAFARDIEGVGEGRIAEVLVYASDDDPLRATGRSRGVRKAVQQGRLWWSRLGAWPWWCSRPPGALPDGWWREPVVEEVLETWSRARVAPSVAPFSPRPLLKKQKPLD